MNEVDTPARAIAHAPAQTTAVATLDDQQLVDVLRSSLYPGASPASVKLVLGYCRAAGLDPMQKPVHIVPMKVSTGEKDRNGWDLKETRDVVMPGIGLYRIQAARTGQYVGCTEPEFGPMREMRFVATAWEDGPDGRRTRRKYEDVVEFPEWCRVTVKRLVGGVVCEFTAKEYWRENYATKSADSEEPNAMWRKRVMGQLAKCAEAQALRKGFPEVGSQPTAEEMAGRHSMNDWDTVDEPARAPAAPVAPPPPATYPDSEFQTNLPTWEKVIQAGKRTAAEVIRLAGSRYPLTDAQRATIERLQQPRTPAPRPAPQAAPEPAQDAQEKPAPAQGEPEVVWTYAQVASRLARAQDRDQLEAAADLIRLVSEEQHRQELQAIYREAAERLN